MFKSVFTKYITAFMLLIFFSFLIIAVILCGTASDYSTNAKSDTVSHTAELVSDTVENMFIISEDSDFNRYVYSDLYSIEKLLSVMAEHNDDLNILIVDSNGALLVHNNTLKQGYIKGNIPADILDKANKNGSASHDGNLNGTFEKKNLVHIFPVHDTEGNFVGATVVCSESHQVDALIESMIKTIILSCLWVMLAALVAVFFISEKIIGPLKQMSVAAKSFAAGKFDVRVPVRGRDEVAELATAFNNMATSLAGLEDMRRTFLSSVSHDLRTPMTTISGFIDGIIDGAIPPEKHEYYLGVIRSEVLRLSRLVSSLLDIARIQAGERKFTKSAFDICEMARLILISFEQKIDAKHLDVEFDCNRDKMIVYADRDAIYQILYNICDNAVKFSRDGGKYKIEILEKEKRVYISVFNEGDGIPSEELPFVFERFYKSDRSRGLDKTGVGLGLYIAKTIIDAHNEEIWVKSVYGENCEFVFTLPYTPEAEIVVKD